MPNPSTFNLSPETTVVPTKGYPFASWLLLLLPLGYLWLYLIDKLWLEWSTDPQYSYGMFVPVLVIGLLFRRWHQSRNTVRTTFARNPWFTKLLCFGMAAFYLPICLVEEATPEWRPLQWALAIQVISLTLYAVYLAGGKNWVAQAAFPLIFLLVAIPWPTLFEAPIIQGLSRLNAAMVVNVLGIVGVPAIQHGNIIEVRTGMVGINDACSGIRSFQSSLMISLFLGEFYRFTWRRRLLYVPISLTLALMLNVLRTSLLTWIASRKGTDSIAQYHDEAGWTILMICTAFLWGAGWLLNRHVIPGANQTLIPGGCYPQEYEFDQTKKVHRRLNHFAIVLTIWLLGVETSVQLWYQIRESHMKLGPSWSVEFPTNNTTYQTIPVTYADHLLLRFDQGQKGQWRDTDGAKWQAFYFNWQPGRVAGYLAKRHTPDICITAAGYKMTSGPELMMLNVHGIVLPMRHYIFSSVDGPLQVYQCHWEAGLRPENYTVDESARFNQIRSVWAGRGNLGQKVLEIIITGYDNPDFARKALIRQLDKLIVVDKS